MQDNLAPQSDHNQLLFGDEEQPPQVSGIEQEPWLLMIIDDDESIHGVTHLVLDGFSFDGRPVKIIDGYSGEEARRLLNEYPETAVMLLDVVMETSNAGLDVVRYIRRELNNQLVRIILRTGQPGQAPEHRVVVDYDINDYKEKTELTGQKLMSSVVTSLRAYRDLKTIEQLVMSNEQLEQRIHERTAELVSTNEALQTEINERMNAQDALAKHQDQLLAVVNNSSALISLKDSQGNYLLVNTLLASLFNVSPDEVRGCSDYDIFPATVADQFADHHRKVLELGEPIQFDEEIPVGDEMHTYVSVKFPLFDKNDNLYAVGSISTDITERIRIELALQTAYDELEQKISERTADLKTARDEAVRANQAKSEFLSRMSHELRTPLNAVLGFSQLLKMDVESPLSEEQSESVDEIIRGGKHLLQLINDVLDLSKVEANKLEIDIVDAPLAALVSECIRLIKPLIEERQLRLEDRVSDMEEVYVRADVTRLKQVLINLLSNAVKYNCNMGSVAIFAEPGTHGFIKIGVSDTGRGIAPELQAQLFKSFERLDAESRNIEGTGIGLAIAKRMTELMGGRIGLVSRVGEGSTFWVELMQSTPTSQG